MGDLLRRADGGMAKVLAIDQIRLDEPQAVYNFTVKGPHTYFVLDAAVLVHNDSCPQWVDDILRQRRIDKPEGVALDTDAIDLVRNEIEARLSRISDLNAREVALKRFYQETAAILEVDGRWYLGLNAQLDEVVASNVVGGVAQTRFRVTGRPRLKVSDTHAETHAIIEYWDALERNPNPASGKMVVSRQPCRSCLRDYVPDVSYSPYEGNIAYVGQAANLEAIDVSYIKSNGDRAVSNPFIILPRKARQIGGIYP